MKLIELIAKNYPTDTRVELVEAREDQEASVGDVGTVLMVTDGGEIIVEWDNEIISAVVFRRDRVRKVVE